MPNIEIHGVQDPRTGLDNKLYMQIADLVDGAEYEDDLVITIVNDEVLATDSLPRPFLRIVSTPGEHLDDVTNRLRSLQMDMEILELKRFIQRP